MLPYKLKRCPITASGLVTSDFKKHFYIQCDASKNGLGGMLFQRNDGGKETPIVNMSVKVNKAQKNSTVTELSKSLDHASKVYPLQFLPIVPV